MILVIAGKNRSISNSQARRHFLVNDLHVFFLERFKCNDVLGKERKPGFRFPKIPNPSAKVATEFIWLNMVPWA